MVKLQTRYYAAIAVGLILFDIALGHVFNVHTNGVPNDILVFLAGVFGVVWAIKVLRSSVHIVAKLGAGLILVFSAFTALVGLVFTLGHL
jgi:hypothetical protein